MAQSLPLTQQQTTRSTRLPTFTGSRSLSRQALAYHSSHRAHYRPCRIAASHLEREHSSLSASTNTDTKGKSKCSPLPDFNTSIRWGATLQVSPWQIPHSQKLAKGGEDTYFISQDASVFGVFDGMNLKTRKALNEHTGVGGWSSRGIDPRDYSSEISRLCEEATNEQYLIDPREILQYAHLKISQKAVIGSWYDCHMITYLHFHISTACLISVTSNAMKAINLGDSGFFVLRGSDILVKSKEQQHRFNMPFQIGYQSADTPLSADTYNIALENVGKQKQISILTEFREI